MFAESGAYIFGRRTYEFVNGWSGRHPVNGAPTFVLTHPSIKRVRWPGEMTSSSGGASPGKQALAAGLCDEILIHLAPYLLGGGVRLFDALPDSVRLDKLSVSDGPVATQLRYRVKRD